jgi:hypothetical protein
MAEHYVSRYWLSRNIMFSQGLYSELKSTQNDELYVNKILWTNSTLKMLVCIVRQKCSDNKAIEMHHGQLVLASS